MEKVNWQNRSLSFKVTYEFVSNSYLFVEVIKSDISGEEDMVEF